MVDFVKIHCHRPLVEMLLLSPTVFLSLVVSAALPNNMHLPHTLLYRSSTNSFKFNCQSRSVQQQCITLILSWSAPSSPVQLHYTVTVWLTNTSTTTITMFNTSSTTITISRDNITISAGSSECYQYVWSVTAVNPAGSSLPTNSTTPVSFVTGIC